MARGVVQGQAGVSAVVELPEQDKAQQLRIYEISRNSEDSEFA